MCKDDSLLFRKLEHTRSSCLIFAKGQVESILLYITVGCLTKPKKRPKYSLFLLLLSTFANLLIKCLNSYDYYFNCTLIGDIRDIREKRMKSELACMSIWFDYYYLFFIISYATTLLSLALLSCYHLLKFLMLLYCIQLFQLFLFEKYKFRKTSYFLFQVTHIIVITPPD